MYFTQSSFWEGVAERAVKTFAQTLAASLTAGVAITEIDWKGALAIAATATLLSVLTSLADPARADLAETEVPYAEIEETDADEDEGEPAEYVESDAVAGDDSVKANLPSGKHALTSEDGEE